MSDDENESRIDEPRRDAARHVGILVETEDSWGRHVVEAACRFGQRAGWAVLISPRDARGALRLPRVWSGHGVIAAMRTRATVQHLRALRVPVVDVSNTLAKEPWFARVTTDDRVRAEMAVDHLSGRGVRQFACYAPAIGRYSGVRAREFRACVEARGFPCATYLGEDEPGTGWLTNYTKVSEWLADLPRPLGVFAADPYPARQLAEICATNGVRVPDGVAILSGDDDELLCHVASPQISSIELASRQIGETAAEILQGLMDGGAVPEAVRRIPPLRVRPRQSTDLLAIDDLDVARALRYIRERAGAGLDVAAVARACFVSRRTLEKKFRDRLGRSPGEEIRRARFERVKRLLLDSDRSIASIALECGFSSGESLSQAFQKQLGEPPGRYRRARRNDRDG
ncbi:AraC family transcriptional regulator [Alienimonas californiensis]|uniref:Xylose operon regulatory protein n=1 Tax=Alienimonas californiensis TaxID=2527989 RepID=A0A517P5T5_9PLAN|nr:DNA-binding transcriptional regulator [Alienimonas californiensis]QDT14731.1 Xylose operon regulatory protein [Alienimonas californiensis]